MTRSGLWACEDASQEASDARIWRFKCALVEGGHDITTLHRGTHEHAETPPQVEHLHADPFDEASLRAAVGGTT